ncbi:hypothetical protein RHRU231_810006 [Rhodococcus ruber]|uniref:Uncharacterized protein n=1 Tax=Rhodococcus ruber TaxID=1830 RepID=A0A098BSK9_9NOCA|nr:hypothetical protein RHRU231_810006 [Rhodococcus ruber]
MRGPYRECGRRSVVPDAEGDAASREPGQRIDLVDAVEVDLEVQVRAGGLATVAHGGDLVTRHDLLTDGHEGLVDVTVDGDGAVGVAQTHPHAEPGRRTGVDDGAVGDREDRGSDGTGDVHTGVQGSPAGAVAGGEDARGRQDEQGATGGGLAGGALLAEALALGEQIGELGQVVRVRDVEDLRGLGGSRALGLGLRGELGGLRHRGGGDDVRAGGVGGEGDLGMLGVLSGAAGGGLTRGDDGAGGDREDRGTALEGGGRSGNAVGAAATRRGGRITVGHCGGGERAGRLVAVEFVLLGGAGVTEIHNARDVRIVRRALVEVVLVRLPVARVEAVGRPCEVDIVELAVGTAVGAGSASVHRLPSSVRDLTVTRTEATVTKRSQAWQPKRAGNRTL